jgi:hypothetical protein
LPGTKTSACQPAQQVEGDVAAADNEVRLVTYDPGVHKGPATSSETARIGTAPTYPPAWGIITAVLYDVLVGLHVVSAVIGFGAVALSGIYGSTARHLDRPEAREETARYFRSPGRAEWLLLAVPFLGAAALGARPEGADFGAVWVITAAVVWLGAAVLFLGVVRPAQRQIRAANGPEQIACAGRRLMWAALASEVLFVVALVLMIGQPA